MDEKNINEIDLNEELKKFRETEAESKEIFKGNLLHIFKDTVNVPNGRQATRELFRHLGAVCIVPVTDDGKIVLERQYRYPIDQVITEIPAGKLDSADEDRLDAAKRELREETGISAEKWTDIGLYYPAAAYSDEKITMYMAEGLSKGETDLDPDEIIDVYEVPLEDVVNDILSGKITDGKTQVAVLKVYEILKNRK